MAPGPLPVQFLPRAADEAEHIAVWYEAQRSDLGRQFMDELRSRLDELAQHPTRGLLTADDAVGQIRLHRFPYLISYRTFPDHLLILAIGHTRRHPSFWPPR